GRLPPPGLTSPPPPLRRGEGSDSALASQLPLSRVRERDVDGVDVRAAQRLGDEGPTASRQGASATNNWRRSLSRSTPMRRPAPPPDGRRSGSSGASSRANGRINARTSSGPRPLRATRSRSTIGANGEVRSCEKQAPTSTRKPHERA